MIEQTKTDFETRYPKTKVYAIHGDDANPDYKPVPVIDKHLDECGDDGEVLIITHAAFQCIDYWHNKQNWTLIYDEVPQVDYNDTKNYKENPGVILDLCEFHTYNADYTVITPRDNGDLKDRVRNVRKDSIWGDLSEFCGKLDSDNWVLYVLSEQLADFRDDTKPECQLTIFGLMQPDLFKGFESVSVMGAFLADSVMFHIGQSLALSSLRTRISKAASNNMPTGT